MGRGDAPCDRGVAGGAGLMATTVESGIDGVRPPSPAHVEKKLFLIRYRAAEGSHVSLADPALCEKCDKPCLWFCPAAVYQWEGGHMHIAWENCLECGTCRIACPSGNVEWRQPAGGCGIAYKRG